MGITLYQLRQISAAAFEECGLVSVICEWEGLVSADFKVGKTGFGSFRLVSASFGWFQEVPLFSNYSLALAEKLKALDILKCKVS